MEGATPKDMGPVAEPKRLAKAKEVLEKANKLLDADGRLGISGKYGWPDKRAEYYFLGQLPSEIGGRGTVVSSAANNQDKPKVGIYRQYNQDGQTTFSTEIYLFIRREGKVIKSFTLKYLDEPLPKYQYISPPNVIPRTALEEDLRGFSIILGSDSLFFIADTDATNEGPGLKPLDV